MSQLNRTNLIKTGPEIGRPRFDVSQLSPGIVHFGIGAFARAHIATYTQNAINQSLSRPDWGITGVSFLRPVTQMLLQPQNYLYTVCSRSNDSDQFEIIGSLSEVLFHRADRKIVPKLVSRDSIKIVSLTISEKGYCYDPMTGALDVQHVDIQHDISNPHQPISAIGTLAEGLRLRYQHNGGPLTVMSCDNLLSNGDLLRKVVRCYIDITTPDLVSWMDDNVSFPKSVVDRMVPATTKEDIVRVENAIGCCDQYPVVTEPFSQWVCEDNFMGRRPDWESVGVEFVRSIEEYEMLKLRLLNGPHSSVAYLALLCEIDTVSDAMKLDVFQKFLSRMMNDEIIPSLNAPKGLDLEDYKRTVLSRFSNRKLSHKTLQIAADGSQKIPQRLVESLRYALKNDLPIDCLALTIAAWMRYTTGITESGGSIKIMDPMHRKLQSIGINLVSNDEKTVLDLLNLTEIFGPDLGSEERVISSVIQAVKSLYSKGALQTLAELK